MFVDSVRREQENEDGESTLESRASPDLERPYILALLSIGAQRSKLIAPDIRDRITNTRGALECYKRIVAYCDKHETCEAIEKELAVARELVELLPIKIAQLEHGGQ